MSRRSSWTVRIHSRSIRRPLKWWVRTFKIRTCRKGVKLRWLIKDLSLNIPKLTYKILQNTKTKIKISKTKTKGAQWSRMKTKAWFHYRQWMKSASSKMIRVTEDLKLNFKPLRIGPRLAYQDPLLGPQVTPHASLATTLIWQSTTKTRSRRTRRRISLNSQWT